MVDALGIQLTRTNYSKSGIQPYPTTVMRARLIDAEGVVEPVTRGYLIRLITLNIGM